MTLARELGNGPHRPFGSALRIGLQERLVTPERVIERPRRLRNSPPCPSCGDAGPFYCDCEEEI
jgi:hypothetical protein